MKRLPLLVRIVIAIALGVLLGRLLPEWAVAVFTTFNAVFSSLLKFLIPLIIVGLVMPAIADIGRSAGRLLLITVCIAYGSTVLSGLFSYGVSDAVFPHLITSSSQLSTLNAQPSSIAPYFTLAIPPLLDVMSALVFAFVAGLGMAYLGLPRLKDVADDFKVLIERTIGIVVIPLLPLYIFGIFLEMTRTGQAWHIIMTFAAIIGVIFAMHIALLLVQYCIAGIVVRRNPLRLLATMLPAYFTALGTSSSAATIPVTKMQAVKMGVSEDIASFTVPLCATIHMSGSCMKITACAVALMLMQGLPFTTPMFVGFILMLGVMMVASPGVPGGAIMASLGVLSSMLGFGEQDCALMIALYIAMDSFGTACNVTGDGAISLILDRLQLKAQSSLDIDIPDAPAEG
ncbi:MAG: dicarboxylate/amino acid:cation symporter [Bacteroidaceae bacterium]|nr:dicarboxylate/amino acid:cation symporter [Bacteroidaceae bacterium]